MKHFLFLLTAITIFSLRSICQQRDFPIKRLDSFITKAMNDWRLMGLSIAIVKKDTVILSKGYGFRDFENKLPVNENTLFPIASCSKTFTAALIGLAEKDKLIQLDKPVHSYFPEFQLYTDQLTKEVTVEDMLAHRTGSAGHDWAWSFNTDLPTAVYIKRIKHQEPFARLRTQFQYSNFMYIALSELTGKLYKTTWNELVKTKLFLPLEMNNTYSNYVSTKYHDTNAAFKYEFKDSFHRKPTNQMDDLLGAGSINSTAADLSKYLQMWINGGKYKKKDILPADFVRRSLESRFVVSGALNRRYPDEHFMNIGLSWFLTSYRGHYTANHTGNIDGFSSSLTFFPMDSLGIVVLANQNGSPLINLVPSFVADIRFDLPARDKNSDFLQMRRRYDSVRGKPAFVNIDTISIKPLFAKEKYTGHFQNPGYGELKIEQYQKALLLTYYNLKLVLIPKGGHLFSSHYLEDEGVEKGGVGNVIFKFDKSGVLQSLQIPFEPMVKDIVFVKKSSQ
jgi:CubicO group peptidase (beta-lactamase class C family)